MVTSTTQWQSRSVLRMIEAGSSAICVTCDDQIKFRAKVRANQVICNVYVDGKWDRVEHYHFDCYDVAGKPYGESASDAPSRINRPSRVSSAA